MTARPRFIKKTGRFQAITWDVVDKKFGPTKVFDSEHEARDWARNWERDRRDSANRYGIEFTSRESTTTFAEYATKIWQPSGSPSTQDSYRGAANALAKIWPTENIDAITPAMVKAAQRQMQARHKPSTCSGRMTVMRHIFRDAVTDKLRIDDPTVGIKGAKVSRSKGNHRPLDEEEFEAVLAKLPKWMHVAVLLAYDSGLRISEVAGVRWFRVNLQKATIMVADVLLANGTTRDTPKGGKPAEVPLSPRTVAALVEHRKLWPGGSMDRVMLYSSGRRAARYASQHTIRREWNYAVEAAELTSPRPRFHDLRHSRAYRLAQADRPLQEIADFLRHENLEITRVYTGKTSIAQLRAGMVAADGPRKLASVG